MWDLRWALLALGILVIGAVYVWSRRFVGRSRESKKLWKPSQRQSAEASRPGMDNGAMAAGDNAAERVSAKSSPPIDRVVAVRCIAKNRQLPIEQVVRELAAASLKHGRYGIFHRDVDETERDPLFSVANLTEPGSFDLTKASDSTTAGLSFFMVLPGCGDAVERFDLMVQTARELARELDAELYDETGSFWSIQRERYVREEIILYRRKRERS